MPYQLNEHLTGFTCLRCRRTYPVGFSAADRGLGCPACLEDGYPASLTVTYADDRPWTPVAGERGLRRYADRLPYRTFPTLGEGDTPLVPLPDLAQELGLETLWLKNEGANPTGSHKDRMSPFVVARAAALGFETVAVASSGNAGASLAAYAAAAGLGCVVVSTRPIRPTWEQAIRFHGAELLLVDEPLERWHLIRAKVEQGLWYPSANHLDPPLGSNPYGVQGFKTVAWEILEASAPMAPTVIVVPTARGDHLWGIWQGLVEAAGLGVLDRLPRLVAAEPFARLSRVLAGADYRDKFAGQAPDMPSITGDTVTHQAMIALRGSNGLAVEAGSDEARAAQIQLAGRGFYVERSSATAFAGLLKLVDLGAVGREDRVVLLITSHGYKEPPTLLD
jgi:threonine synthase